MKVHWTSRAKFHLRSIYDYIAKDSPQYAKLTIDKITYRSKQIAEFPKAGRIVPEFGDEHTREIFEGKYRIMYRILEERIDVLAVIHSARIHF